VIVLPACVYFRVICDVFAVISLNYQLSCGCRFALFHFAQNFFPVFTGPSTNSLGASIVLLSGICRLSGSVTPQWACRQLHLCSPGDDVMPPPV